MLAPERLRCALLLAEITFQGEEKILVTGPWYSQAQSYQILFDGLPVPTTLVQTHIDWRMKARRQVEGKEAY